MLPRLYHNKHLALRIAILCAVLWAGHAFYAQKYLYLNWDELYHPFDEGRLSLSNAVMIECLHEEGLELPQCDKSHPLYSIENCSDARYNNGFILWAEHNHKKTTLICTGITDYKVKEIYAQKDKKYLLSKARRIGKHLALTALAILGIIVLLPWLLNPVLQWLIRGHDKDRDTNPLPR